MITITTLKNIPKLPLISIAGIIVTSAVCLTLSHYVGTVPSQVAATKPVALHQKTQSASAATPAVDTTADSSTQTQPQPSTTKQSNSNTASVATPKYTGTPMTTPVVPLPPVAPAPPAATPSFKLVLHPENGMDQPIAGFMHFDIPYELAYDPGFTPTNSLGGTCMFLSAPASSNVLCNVSEKGSVLSIQYDNSSPSGHYIVQMTYSLNGVTRSDACEFDLN